LHLTKRVPASCVQELLAICGTAGSLGSQRAPKYRHRERRVSVETVKLTDQQSPGVAEPFVPALSSADDLADGEVRLRLQWLEGSTQAALATLRRSLIEKALPTRDGLAREAAIAFDLEDDQQALAMIDEIAQTLGISAFG
jgi:hypothetical protein